ncbi:MAG: FMN-binding protein [Acholeplasmataceae bacterium]
MDVDLVTGATHSSKAIILTVTDALSSDQMI